MYLAIIVLPLLGSIVSGFLGRKVGVQGSQWVTSSLIMVITLIAVIIFNEIVINDTFVSITTIRWIDAESLNIVWGFNFDSLTSSMLIPVLIISFLVHIYSIGYMSHDPHNQRFFSYLSLFTFMMIILVTANNFLVMFVGWEGVGVCSYLLVNFWYTRIAANQSSMSAFLTNRVGDCFLTLGMFAILWTFGNLDYSTVFSLAPFTNENAITLIGVCLLIGAMAKSSQIGLHVWLPLAMEGPTPVSALIHAATMVTAGVYLLMRSSPLIEYSSTVLILCLWIGSITTIFSSLVGLFQQDIKKVIAYSTMSQLARKHIFIMFRHQTICVDFFDNYTLFINNSQITKAHNYTKRYNYISINIFNSFSYLRLFASNISYMWKKWNVIIIRKLVGISEAIRLILIYLSYFFSTNILSIIKILNLIIYNVSTINNLSLNPLINNDTLNKNSTAYCEANYLYFYEWLAGVIDGDGYFNLSKKGIARFNIVMDIRDKPALVYIQQKLGGSIYNISNANALRYQLTSKKNLIRLINNINGLIRNPTRLLQMNKLCVKYHITLIYPKPLTFNNGWLSGFIDSDGSIYVNIKSGQIIISVSQKNMYLLEPLINIYGGRVDPLGIKTEAFKYIIYRKTELFNLIDNYFVKYPLKTVKGKRLNLIKDFYLLRMYETDQDINKLNLWVQWKDKWDKYN